MIRVIIDLCQDSTYQGDRFNGHMGSQQHSQYLSQFSQVLLILQISIIFNYPVVTCLLFILCLCLFRHFFSSEALQSLSS